MWKSKEEIKEYMKDWRKANREHINEQRKEYYKQHKSEYSNRAKRYRETHKEILKERYKERYLKNKDKRKERNKQSYIKNKEKIAERHKKYEKTEAGKEARKRINKAFRLKHKKDGYFRKYIQSEKGRKYAIICTQKRRARKKNVIHDFSQEEWEAKVIETNGYCPRCNKLVGIENLTLDHIYPISKAEPGRVYTINDVEPLCQSCNSKKGVGND